MALLVHPGYMGYADVSGVTQIRFTDANITAKQDINIPDLIMGNYDRMAYNANKIEVGGTISGPVTDTFASGGAASIWGWATARGSCGELTQSDVTLYYYCGTPVYGGNARTFEQMQVNSINFSCAAGDIAQFSLDVMARNASSFDTVTPALVDREDKLITWDQTNVSVSNGNAGNSGTDLGSSFFSNFEFTVANNIEPVYAIGQSNLFPYEIVPGIRTITGSLSAYDIPGANGYDQWADLIKGGQATISFNIGGTPFSMKVFFHRIEPASTVGPIMSTVAFSGAGQQTF